MKNNSTNQQRGTFAEVLESITTSKTMSPAEKVARVHDLAEQLRQYIDGQPTRSAWSRGVKYYAGYLLDNFKEYAEYDTNNGQRVELTEAVLLNGAADWSQYSCGGCALIYDGEIAETVCTPSELRRKRGGKLQPNSRETWLDVQARALAQAWRRIRAAMRWAPIRRHAVTFGVFAVSGNGDTLTKFETSDKAAACARFAEEVAKAGGDAEAVDVEGWPDGCPDWRTVYRYELLRFMIDEEGDVSGMDTLAVSPYYPIL